MVIVLKKKRIIKSVFVLIILFTVVTILSGLLIRALYPLRHEDSIIKHSQSYGLDPYLVMGIISAESRFDETAISHKNAKGLMQLREETAEWCVEKFNINTTHERIYEPDTNIMIGCCYLSYLLELFGGEVRTAVAAYNAGQGNVSEWLKNPSYSPDGKKLENIPFPETEAYVEKVSNRQNIYRKLYNKNFPVI